MTTSIPTRELIATDRAKGLCPLSASERREKRLRTQAYVSSVFKVLSLSPKGLPEIDTLAFALIKSGKLACHILRYCGRDSGPGELLFYRYRPGFWARFFSFSSVARLRICSMFSSEDSALETLPLPLPTDLSGLAADVF